MKRFLCILAVLISVVLVSVACAPTLDNAGLPLAESASTLHVDGGPAESPNESNLMVHFIDVGQADCQLLLCGGQSMLVDAGNNADGKAVVDYIRRQGVQKLDYIVGTHPHEDHIGGLDDCLDAFDIGIVMMPDVVTTTKTFSDVLESVQNKGLSITVPKAGNTFPLGTAEVEVLGPVSEYDSLNNSSVVLRVELGEVSFLLTGDIEKEAEKDIIESGVNLESTVLKSPHHGSNSSSTYHFLREVNPQYIVIEVGAGNDYGHPHEETMSRYRDQGATVLCTDKDGTIQFATDGKDINVVSDATSIPLAPVQTDKTNPAAEEYVGNLNSKKYHLSSCDSLPKQENRIYFATKEEAETQGYTPCGNCKP